MAATKGWDRRFRRVGEVASTVLLAAAVAGCGARPPATLQSAPTAAVSEQTAAPPAAPTGVAPGPAAAISPSPAATQALTPAAAQGPAPTPLPVPEEIAGALSKAYTNVDWFQAVATVTMDTGAGGVITATIRQWFKQPSMVKLEVIKSDSGKLVAGSEIIFNGKQLTMYDAGTNQVTQLQDPSQLMLFFNLPQLQMLPMLQLLQGQRYLSALASQARVAVNSSDNVANRECTVVQLTPNPGTSVAFQEIRSCLDTRTMFPLRIQGLGPGGNLLASIEYSAFDRVTQLSDESFSFRPPTTAKEVKPSPEQVADMAGFQPVTLQEMQARAGFPLLQPSVLPNGMTLRSVREATLGGTVVVALVYGTDTQNGTAVLVERPARLMLPAIRLGQPASRDSFAGQLYDGADAVQLEWAKGNTLLTLASTLPKAQAMEMAGSVR